MHKFTRRNFIAKSVAGMGALSLSAITSAGSDSGSNKLNVICVGGHPDDPETGCGGTLAKLAAAGHNVTIIYLTRGEAGIGDKTHSEAAAIRTREAEAACAILNARPIFAGQIDGATIVNNEWVAKLQQLIEKEKPDILFTHWPVDSHKDHQCASLLTIQAWIQSNRKAALYFYEVCIGGQTSTFSPTDYTDITDTQEQKRKAVYCHASQHPDEIYNSSDCNHDTMEKFRGLEMGVKAAEGFVRMTQSLQTFGSF